MTNSADVFPFNCGNCVAALTSSCPGKGRFVNRIVPDPDCRTDLVSSLSWSFELP